MLEICSYTQTNFALFEPPHLSAIASGQIMTNRWSCLKNSHNIFATLLISDFFFSASLLLGPLKICWSTGKVSLNSGTMPLQEFGNRVPKYLHPTRSGLGLGLVHICFVSAWTCSLGSWACWKWKITFLSTGICVGEKHKVFVSIQQVQLWDLWFCRIHNYGSSQSCAFCGNNP